MLESKIYAMVGDSSFTVCQPHLQPMNTIEMLSVNPDPQLMIAQPDGTWAVSDQNAIGNRQEEILRAWPVDKQLEAIVESMENPPRTEKLMQLQSFLQEIKLKYPK